ncbi:PREDICTED: uncharacterized protein LOC104611989 [Nelumbo nucifera]|uniref:Uncharacterized protein LOC104611989 n=2 Tax=Nelumbo nucifera TaxID=4432 RepID=A0A1U8B8Y0_NELNU|nr:PREDICTED: uncharacterized protein LOC104611989 [Nelumbo nucifera]DAD29419.1 TPA_asm: hypothetical protein HUJ06_030887 [Nelumbo nucifera]
MEEIREVALSYYHACSAETKQMILNFFRELDSDQNGYITINEFTDYLMRKGCSCLNPNFFLELDKDRNGLLDFEEVITFYYIVEFMRLVFCDGCGCFLKSSYFTCVDCYYSNEDNNTYDLCPRCYRTGNYARGHELFLDNHALLQLTGKLIHETNQNQQSASVYRTQKIEQRQLKNPRIKDARTESIKEGVKAFAHGVTIGNVVGTAVVAGCSIM